MAKGDAKVTKLETQSSQRYKESAHLKCFWNADRPELLIERKPQQTLQHSRTVWDLFALTHRLRQLFDLLLNEVLDSSPFLQEGEAEVLWGESAHGLAGSFISFEKNQFKNCKDKGTEDAITVCSFLRSGQGDSTVELKPFR